MRALDLNFASTPFRNYTPYYLGYGLSAALLVAFTAYNSWAYFAYSKSQAELETDHAAKKDQIEAFYQETSRLQESIKKKNIEVINERATFTNTLLDRRRFSWTDLLNSLEEVQPYQVRLLSLIPRIGPKGIVIEARAVSIDLRAFWNFQQNLQNHEKFRHVYPGGYTRNNDAGEYIFNIAFSYFPAGAPPDVPALSAEDLAQAGIVEAPGEQLGPGSDEAEAEEEEAAVPEEVEKPGPPPALIQKANSAPPTKAIGRAPAGSLPVKGAKVEPRDSGKSAAASPPAGAANRATAPGPGSPPTATLPAAPAAAPPRAPYPAPPVKLVPRPVSGPANTLSLRAPGQAPPPAPEPEGTDDEGNTDGDEDGGGEQ